MSAVTDGNLRKLFRKHLPEVFWTSIESRLTQQGIPDLHGVHESKTFWIENKKARGNTVRFQPFQLGWLHRYHRAGGACFIAIRQDASLWLAPGSMAGALAAQGVACLPARACLGAGGPSGWRWAAVLRALASGPRWLA